MARTTPSKFAFQKRVQARARELNQDFSYLEQSLANIVFAQILVGAKQLDGENYYFKGGTSLLFRFGIEQSRATQDVDMTFATDKQAIEYLVFSLIGNQWQDFRIRGVKLLKSSAPSWVPEHERILRFKVQITFGNSEWRTVLLEASIDDSVADTARFEVIMGENLSKPFEDLGLSSPTSVPVMKAELQIAQKIHACLAPNSTRGHDLYDIHKVLESTKVDLNALAVLTAQTFAQRGRHELSTEFVPLDELRNQYILETNRIVDSPSFEEALKTFRALLPSIDEHLRLLESR
jgi:predicted nucleotidyltransferase component of viral defense system